MRSRTQIEGDAKAGQPLSPLLLEVLLDMRDLLARLRRQTAIVNDT